MVELALLTCLTWLTYLGAVNNGFVSDDIQAIIEYNGEFRGWDYGNLTKFIFYRLFQKSPRRNHIFSILLHNTNVILLYLLLLNLTTPRLALLTAILFVVHPVCTQAVAWISARGYPIGLFWMLLSLNIILLNKPFLALTTGSILVFCTMFVLVTLLYFLGIHAQFAVMMTFVIYAFLGNYFLALVGATISFVMCLGIVKEVIGIRAKVFKEQAMGATTKFHYRRFVIAIKSLWYYTMLCLFPKRMGLYHTYGYHYTEEMLKEDKYFWGGFGLLLGCIATIIYAPFIVKFAVIWYLAYLFIFLNWITIHQFVSERYCYIPSIGICLLLAYILQNTPGLFMFIAGIGIMRTWAHLPTYEDEIPFYQSNIWNFPKSEVALANLGVTYMKRGLLGSALDMWAVALKINPKYDVAYYNIASTLKTKGDLGNAHNHLKKAVECPTCHFKELWTKELKDLEHEMEYVKLAGGLGENLKKMIMDGVKKEEAARLHKELTDINVFHKKLEEERKTHVKLIEQQEKEIRQKLVELEKTKEKVSKPANPMELIKTRDEKVLKVKEAYEKLIAGIPAQGRQGTVNPGSNSTVQTT